MGTANHDQLYNLDSSFHIFQVEVNWYDWIFEIGRINTFNNLKLINVYINFMIDANLLTVVNKKKEITPPILDIALERYLIANNAEDIVRALTGVNWYDDTWRKIR